MDAPTETTLPTDPAAPAIAPASPASPASPARAPSLPSAWWSGETLAPWIAGIALALPTLIVDFPPMTDLPLHAAVIGMLRHLNDPSFFPRDLYFLNLGHPNQLFHLLAWGLSYVMSVDAACKVVIAAAQLGILVGGARLARHLGVSQWTAVLLSPLALGWSYFWGLVANLVGFAVLLFALPSLDRAANRPSARGFLVSAAWMPLLYFAHESVMVVACSAVLVFALGFPLRWKETSVRLAPIGVAMGIFFAQLRVQTRMLGSAKAGGLEGIEFQNVWTNLHSVPTTLTGSLDIVSKIALFSLAMLGILLFAVERWRVRKLGQPAVKRFAPLVHRYRFELVALGNGLGFFLMPFGFAGGTMFNHRFYHPAYALFALSLAPQLACKRPALLTRFVAAMLPLGILLIDWPQFDESNRCARELDYLMPEIALGSSVVYIEADPELGTRTFTASTSGARVLSVRGGRLLFSLASSAIAPVQVNPAYLWNEATARVAVNTLNLRPAHDLTMFRYVLLHSRSPFLAVVATQALKPEARFLDMHGEWTLLESTLPMVPLDSPEPPMVHGAQTLRTRVLRLLARAQEQGVIPSDDPVASRAAAAPVDAGLADPLADPLDAAP